MAIRRTKKVAALNNLGLNPRAAAAAILPTSKKRGLKYRGPSDRVQRPAVKLTGKGADVRGC